MSSRFRLLSIALVAVVATACSAVGGGPAGSASSPSNGIAYPTGASDLVLRLRYVGGFVAPAAHLLDVPVISVYGDGTVIRSGPQIAIYPGPALPSLQRATITPAGMQLILAAARDAGLLGPDATYDFVGIADAATAEFTVNADGGVHTVSAYALMEAGETPPQGADPAVTAARAKLANFQAQIGGLEGLLGGELGAWGPYVAGSMQLLVSPGAPDDGQGLAQQPLVWPLTTPLASFGTTLPTLMEGQRCGVVTGADLDALMTLFANANALTPWTDGGASFGIAVRPLLPDEAGCPTAID
jgi:hypothetical protein